MPHAEPQMIFSDKKISNKEDKWKGHAGKVWENVYTFWHNSMKIRLLLVDNNKINQPDWTRPENDCSISIHKNFKWNEMPRKVIIFF